MNLDPLEPIRKDWIHEQLLGRVTRLSMMRIMARRTKASTVRAQRSKSPRRSSASGERRICARRFASRSSGATIRSPPRRARLSALIAALRENCLDQRKPLACLQKNQSRSVLAASAGARTCRKSGQSQIGDASSQDASAGGSSWRQIARSTFVRRIDCNTSACSPSMTLEAPFGLCTNDGE